MLRLPRLSATDSIVNSDGRPASAFQIWWESVVRAIEKAFADIEEVNAGQSDLIEQLAIAVAAIEAAQAAAAQARQAADTANAAAAQAQAVANDVYVQAQNLEGRVRELEQAQQEP